MKSLVLVLTIALLFTAGEALNCRRCVSLFAGGRCVPTVETCGQRHDACVYARFLIQPYGYFQRCIAARHCKILKRSSYIDVNCCTEDMCNNP